MKKVITIFLAAVMMLSMVACDGNTEVTSDSNGETTSDKGGKTNSEHMVSKGLFLLEPNEKYDITYTESFTEQEAYMICVYDIIPDDTKNAEMAVPSFYYTLTLNDENTYESLENNSGSKSLASFVIACGYETPADVGEILAGGEPIRAISVFKINKNDINENTTVEFEITNNGIYSCKQTFEREDIITIDNFDDIYQIEDNPSDYQIASSLYIRTLCIQELIQAIYHGVESIDQINDPFLISNCVNLEKAITVPVYASSNANIESQTALDSVMYEEPGSEMIPDYDKEAVKRVYPELANDVDKLDENIPILLATVVPENIDENGNFISEELSNSYKSSLSAINTATNNIISFFDSM